MFGESHTSAKYDNVLELHAVCGGLRRPLPGLRGARVLLDPDGGLLGQGGEREGFMFERVEVFKRIEGFERVEVFKRAKFFKRVMVSKRAIESI